ncbi:MAG TPA: hypothetical protein VKD72_28805, partial [Gemmataceae bacterium]|nr:hypothetical protein [Gemmataceae bacterium]
MGASVNRLRRGWFQDPECHRETYRLQGALRILALWGAEPVFPEHTEKCIRHPDNRHCRVHGVMYSCDNGCTVGWEPVPTWPEWVSDEVLGAAYAAACALQTARGAWHPGSGIQTEGGPLMKP